jgi:histidine ammonia-lyase
VTGALSTDAIMGSTAPLLPEIHTLRGHAARSRWRPACALLAGSQIRESHRGRRYPRSGPLLHPLPAAGAGAAIDLLRQAAATLEIEANAATDNPLVLSDGGSFPAAISTPNRWPSPQTRSRSPSPRSARSRSAASR